MNAIRLLLVLLLVTGCASKIWDRPGTPVQEARADLWQCQYEAERAVAGYAGSGAIATFKIEDLTHACMESRGYRASMQ